MTPRPGPRARLLATAAVGVTPWVLVRSSGTWSLVVGVGLVGPDPLHFTSIWSYLLTLTRGLPLSLLAWPIAGLIWFGGLVSAASGLALDREDRRVTGGLLVLAGACLLPLASAVGRPAGVLAIPVGTVVFWAVAWWAHGDALGQIARAGPRDPPR